MVLGWGWSVGCGFRFWVLYALCGFEVWVSGVYCRFAGSVGLLLCLKFVFLVVGFNLLVCVGGFGGVEFGGLDLDSVVVCLFCGVGSGLVQCLVLGFGLLFFLGLLVDVGFAVHGFLGFGGFDSLNCLGSVCLLCRCCLGLIWVGWCGLV